MSYNLVVPHLMPDFCQEQALEYLHGDLNLDDIGGDTDDFVSKLPEDTQKALAWGMKLEKKICYGREIGIQRYTLLGLMAVHHQSLITTVSEEALNGPKEHIQDIASSPNEHHNILKAQIRYGCRPYYEVIGHLADKHTLSNGRSKVIWVGLIEGYLIANRQISLENPDTDE